MFFGLLIVVDEYMVVLGVGFVWYVYCGVAIVSWVFDGVFCHEDVVGWVELVMLGSTLC